MSHTKKTQTVIYFTMFNNDDPYTECMLNEATHKQTP